MHSVVSDADKISSFHPHEVQAHKVVLLNWSHSGNNKSCTFTTKTLKMKIN